MKNALLYVTSPANAALVNERVSSSPRRSKVPAVIPPHCFVGSASKLIEIREPSMKYAMLQTDPCEAVAVPWPPLRSKFQSARRREEPLVIVDNQYSPGWHWVILTIWGILHNTR